MPDAMIVEVPAGRLRGQANGGVLTFRNVPYARAPRFRPPEPAAPWSDERDAVGRGPICPQLPERLAFATGGVPTKMVRSEDCLNLSITTPTLAGRRPVMVWIHGGAYMSGGGETPRYDARKIAAECGVVVVAVTYRLGVFGYLWQDDPGRRNLGLLDQLAALDWVAANIDRFGGDPDNITAVGQSAGGHSIVAMLQARAQALPFRRAILQSAPIAARIAAEDAARLADAFHEALGQDAERADVALILAAQAQALAAQPPSGLPMGPVLEPAPAPRRGLDVIAGWARDDGSPFVALRKGLSEPGNWFGDEGAGASTTAFTRAAFAEPAAAFAAATPDDAKTYLYRLELRPEGSPFGACHCLDLPLLFGEEADWRGAGMLGTEPWANLERVGHRVRASWGAFATSGDPSTDDGWDWRPYGSGTAGEITSIDR